MASGTYAWVVPGDSCPPSDTKPKYQYAIVSKIVEDREEIEAIHRATQYLQTVKNWESVLIHPFYSCAPSKDQTIFLMQQGTPLHTYLKKPLPDRAHLYEAVRTCLLNYSAIFHTGQNDLHGDIQVDNIVLLEDGTARLIDYNPYTRLATSVTIVSEKLRMTEVLIEILGLPGYKRHDTTLLHKSFSEIVKQRDMLINMTSTVKTLLF